MITNLDLGRHLANHLGGKLTAHHRHALERAGVRGHGKAVRIGPAVTKVSILRNYPLWKDATTGQIQAELTKTVPLSPFEWGEQASVN